MKAHFALLALLALAGWARCEGLDEDQLRLLAKLPTISLEVGARFDSRTGFSLPGDRADAAEEAAAIRAGIQDNPEKFYRLWEIAADEHEGHMALNRAVELLRRKLRAEPKDAWAMARLGQCLSAQGAGQEAEDLLRQALRLAPQDALAWSALGDHLVAQMVEDLGGWELLVPFQSSHLMTLARKGRISGQQAGSAELRYTEALRCHDRAVAAAPGDWRPYRSRAISRLIRHELGPALRLAQGDKADPVMGFRAELLDDWRAVARLRPDDPGAAAVAILTECLAVARRQNLTLLGAGAEPEQIWRSLPPKTREWIDAEMRRLKKLTAAPDKRAAARASEVRGLVLLAVIGDEAKAEKALRRAVALDPDREQAWDLLVFVYRGPGRVEEQVHLCQDRVRRSDSAKARFLLAKAYEDLEQLAEAEDQLRIAVRQHPDDLLSNLGLATVRLKTGKDQAAQEEAKRLLERCRRLMSQKTRLASREEYGITRAIYLGLTGDTAKAKKVLLLDVLSHDLDNRYARRVLAALGK